jgi:RNA polymerase sigma-70 factor (ECF subfamily)
MATTDARRFHRLIEPHLEALFRAAYRLAGTRADAEDLVQDTCIRAFQRVTELQESQAVKAWLLSVLYNRFVDCSRRAERSPVAPESITTIDRSVSPEPSPEEHAMIHQSEEALHQAWLKLEPSQQALLALRAEGYSSAEISEITEVPIEALYARLYRARLNLARQLKEPSESRPNNRLEIAK